MKEDACLPLAEAVRTAYRRGEEDETLSPLVLTDARDRPVGRIAGGDAVIFYNIRGEREIELTRSLTERDFKEFPVEEDLKLQFATMIEYRKGLPVRVAFPSDGIIEDTLSDTIALHGLRQVKITEAEKAVHVGFFLNGKKETLLRGEEKIIVPTRKDVALFDEAPEMSSERITEAVTEHLKGKFGGYEIPRKFLVLEQPFSLDNGTLTQTLKLKRKAVLQIFGGAIEALYSGPEITLQATGESSRS